jgi:hypothetical protein
VAFTVMGVGVERARTVTVALALLLSPFLVTVADTWVVPAAMP